MRARFIASVSAAALLTASLVQRVIGEEVRRDKSIKGLETPGFAAGVSKASIFLPLDFYSRHRDELALDADQARELDRLAEAMREPAQKLESERAIRTNAL